MTQPGGEWNLQSELVPNRDEMGKILALIKGEDERYYTLFFFCANTGLRISEAIHVKAADLVNGKLRVIRRKKKKLQPSSVEISDAVWAIMSKWAEGKKGYLFPGGAAPCIVCRSNGKVIEFCKGGHLHIRTAQNRWRLTIARLGLYVRGRGIHQTRHYFGTQLYAATKDLRATQVAMDHSSSQMTEKYAHVVEQHESVNKVKPSL